MKELSKEDKLHIIDVILENSKTAFTTYLCFEIYDVLEAEFDAEFLYNCEKTDFILEVFPELLQIKPEKVPLKGVNGWFGQPVVGEKARIDALKRLREIIENQSE
jgi:hypothetical protein